MVCPNCRGKGKVMIPRGSSHHCNLCDGSGELRNILELLYDTLEFVAFAEDHYEKWGAHTDFRKITRELSARIEYYDYFTDMSKWDNDRRNCGKG